MTRHDVYVEVATQALRQLPDGEESVLASMVVLHTHDFVLIDGLRPSDMVEALGGKAKLCAVTRRHAAEIVSAALGRTADEDATDYWYAKYTAEAPYELIESVPQPLLGKALACRSVMSQSPLLQAIVPTD